MEYGSYSDEELRRVLNADDRDVDAIVEAAERFRKQTREEDEIFKCADCGSYDVGPA